MHDEKIAMVGIIIFLIFLGYNIDKNTQKIKTLEQFRNQQIAKTIHPKIIVGDTK